MGAATTIGAANRSQCAAGLGPCLFRRTGFDQKHTRVVHPIGSASRPLDHSVPDINRIKRHIAFVPPVKPYAQVYPSGSFASHAAPTRRELLSNIERP